MKKTKFDQPEDVQISKYKLSQKQKYSVNRRLKFFSITLIKLNFFCCPLL